MSVGLPVTKDEINARAGDIARAWQALAQDVITMNGYLASTPDPDLLALGFTDVDIAQMKSGIADAEQHMIRIGYGHEALAAPKDFTAFLRLMWGVGSF